MTVGGIAAWMAYTNKSFVQRISAAPKWIWVVLYAVVLLCFLFRQQLFYHGSLLLAVDRLLISVLFAACILEQNYAANSLFKMSRYKWVSKLGTYTYGLYCLHMIGILIAAKALGKLGWNKNVYQVVFVEGLSSLMITIVLAILSYHLFESRFLKLKHRFARITQK